MKILFKQLIFFVVCFGFDFIRNNVKMADQFVLDTSPISQETKKIAETELNETPERVEESVAELRRLLHENTDLYFRDDDNFLKIFLRPCHYYPESAIKLVSTVYVVAI